jgi:DNA-binding transcriptional MerR regulator
MESTATLLPIGRFSRLSGLGVKALRHYDEIGLLSPARVDDSSGYRYYSLEQLQTADAIARLRAAEVPLETCRAILAEPDPERVRERLRAHRAALEGRSDELQRSLEKLDELLTEADPLAATRITLEKVEMKEVSEQAALTMRSRTTPEDLDPVISESINGVADYMNEVGARRAGPPFTLSSDADDDGVIEVSIGWPTADRLPGRGRVESQLLPRARVAWAVYKGSYAQLPAAYRAVYEWMVENGHEPAGDPREIYYTDPDEVSDPADYVTGIVWPVER